VINEQRYFNNYKGEADEQACGPLRLPQARQVAGARVLGGACAPLRRGAQGLRQFGEQFGRARQRHDRFVPRGDGRL